MIEGLLHEPGEGLRTLCADRFTDRFNQRRVQLEKVERATVNVQLVQYSTCAPAWKLNVERRAFGAYLRYGVVCLLETDQNIPQTAAGLSLSAPWYFPAVVLRPRRDSGGALFLAVLFLRRIDLHAQAATFDLSKLEQMESASVILDRNEKIFGQIYVENRETIPYDQLPRDLVNAVVSMEDNKFYQHGGYDLLGIVRAALKNFTAGHVRQGASTITQQLARNSFALKEKTFRRKLLEIFLSRRIEDRFGKQKIMELYLNRIYFGGGLYGAEAASRGYFGKPAREMSLTECATLAGVIKSPNKLSPWGDKAASRDARNVVLARMRDLGFITRAQCEAAQGKRS